MEDFIESNESNLNSSPSDNKLQQILIQCKKTVKIWELKFSKKEGRLPSKDDFKSGPKDVVDAYKMYYKVKRKLESPSQSLSQTNDNKEVELPQKQAEKSLVNAWGQHLNKKNMQESLSTQSDEKSQPTGYWNMSNKLLEGAKISTRSNIKKLSKKPSKILLPLTTDKVIQPYEEEGTKEKPAESLFIENKEEKMQEKLLVSNNAETFNKINIESSFPTPKFVTSNNKLKNVSTVSTNIVNTIVQPKTALRNVDTSWLDRYTQESAVSSNFSDEDIFYPSDDEAPRKSRITLKRKSNESENEETKKTRLDASAGTSKPEITEKVTEYKEAVVQSSINRDSKPVQKKEERLKRKLESGTMNENFIRINLKKKVFVRGKKQQTGAKYKRQQWKLRQKGTSSANGESSGKLLTCKRCGDVGHYAKNCIGKQVPPTTEDSGVADFSGNLNPELEEMSSLPNFPNLEEEEIKSSDASPLFELQADGSLIETPSIVYKMLKKFGFESFREGQEKAVMRVLSGQSTLVVQSTGAGKSLCYQLPAALYAQQSSCITIVISPLVSLMEDQVSNLPSFLKAGCLHTSQTEVQRQKVLQSLQDSSIQILFLSPESVVSGGIYGLSSLAKILPPIAFVCIDEAHCVSQWSYNFRPAYLQVCKILKQKLKIKTILGLTATVRKSSLHNISQHLGLNDKDPDAVIYGKVLPKNLVLSVSRDRDRDAALLELLAGERFSQCDSIIIYCTRREVCDRLAALLRTSLKDPDRDAKNRGKRGAVSWCAESYHAGLTAARRSSIQKHFMSGKLRIVVATVAFGMGINKSDIRGVIHFNAPRNFESYVQEIGRAGRDGQIANCHVFLNSDASDVNELRRFIYANSVDRHVLRKLLHKVLDVRCTCTRGSCKGHEAAIPIENAVKELDLPEENIATLLCHLERHCSGCVLDVGTHIYATCSIKSYSGADQLQQAAKKCQSLTAASELYAPKKPHFTSFAFPVVAVSSHIGCDSSKVKRDLKNLEWERLPSGKAKKSGIMVEFSDLAFHLKVRGDLNPEEQDSVLEFLHSRCLHRENTELTQLQRIFQAFSSVSHSTCKPCLNRVEEATSDKLHDFVREYFEEIADDVAEGPCGESPISDDSHVRKDVRHLITSFREQSFTARAVARIFHGISSPCFPAEFWGKQRRYWRAHLDKDFNAVMKIAVDEILALR